MKCIATVWVVLVSFSVSGAAEVSATNSAAAASLFRFYDQIYDCLVNEAGAITNDEMIKTPIARNVIIYKAFGLRWDAVPAPTMAGTNALAAVQAYVATNGWNMQTGGLLFTYGREEPRPIRGLPWKAIHKVEFPALTHNGILYVILSGFHHDCGGVAYNPKTNSFPMGISGFKHIGQHWYVWTQPEGEIVLSQEYEGQGAGKPRGSADSSQPAGSGTNRTPAAADSRR
jgi:hypothetical protein